MTYPMTALDREVDRQVSAQNRRDLENPEDMDRMGLQFQATAFLWYVMPGAMAERRDARIAQWRNRDQTVQCPECGRVFNLTDEVDVDEYHHGHDCEGE